jgi:uridine kinase
MYVVGIAGGSASGKTTFTAALAAELESGAPPLRVEVLHMDQYALADRTSGPQFRFSLTGEFVFNMNHPDAFEIDRLLGDIEARAAGVDRPDVVIIEGLMVLHDAALLDRLDLRLFLELDADQRALRRMLRDLAGGRGSRDPRFIAGYYQESARIGHALYVEPSRLHADLILRGDSDFARVAPMVARVIHLRKRSLFP